MRYFIQVSALNLQPYKIFHSDESVFMKKKFAKYIFNTIIKSCNRSITVTSVKK